MELEILNKKLHSILSAKIFQKIINEEKINIEQLNTATNLLTLSDIAFDLSFDPGNRRYAPVLELEIFLTPTIIITFVIQLKGGNTPFLD